MKGAIKVLLISKGKHINMKNCNSFFIIWKEIKERYLNENHKTILEVATQHDLIQIVQMLISKGADIKATYIIYQIIKNHF